ncbi:hypothetical protein BCR42DRAFT_86852 [Absidia repens]|uniref:Uncharacterized protein n=1 Tax=Absidia repens TaxID=90262 RepID=A0A1X2IY23_9FUNG|nr:hypothetical protein BCR42DRAFT_86852 [Absidia repens]
MLSVYSGMDMNFTQSFPTPSFGLARSRVATFEPQEAFRQHQHQQSPPPPPPPPSYSTANLCSSVSLVEPMLQSNILVTPVSSITTPTSSSPSASLMYYDSYSSPFLPNTTVDSFGTANVSVSSSPSLNDSWGYTLPIDVLPESTYNHTFTTSCEPQPQGPQPFMFSPNIPSYPPLPPSSQHQHSQEHDEPLLYPSSSGVQACDPLPNLLSLQSYPSYQQNGRNMHQGTNYQNLHS